MGDERDNQEHDQATPGFLVLCVLAIVAALFFGEVVHLALADFLT